MCERTCVGVCERMCLCVFGCGRSCTLHYFGLRQRDLSTPLLWGQGEVPVARDPSVDARTQRDMELLQTALSPQVGEILARALSNIHNLKAEFQQIKSGNSVTHGTGPISGRQ
jgi:hypothetical protein